MSLAASIVVIVLNFFFFGWELFTFAFYDTQVSSVFIKLLVLSSLVFTETDAAFLLICISLELKDKSVLCTLFRTLIISLCPVLLQSFLHFF